MLYFPSYQSKYKPWVISC
ncbi:unnamed protein product [Spirodela intermedia]|uniref:Uncharacterized protein n=2 Tax=Spirodela intermedia TaxID=51605 RepID=A0A7I8K3Q5_SPIIN|nr:unnamed protein product [Spirodela intermedia]CAA6656258.1 unnamed protein product [Spirodela intermedia]CAA7391784.1 unnamed protein product [Spirodela intermedia]